MRPLHADQDVVGGLQDKPAVAPLECMRPVDGGAKAPHSQIVTSSPSSRMASAFA
jgi:hypothetical protein